MESPRSKDRAFGHLSNFLTSMQSSLLVMKDVFKPDPDLIRSKKRLIE